MFQPWDVKEPFNIIFILFRLILFVFFFFLCVFMVFIAEEKNCGV